MLMIQRKGYLNILVVEEYIRIDIMKTVFKFLNIDLHIILDKYEIVKVHGKVPVTNLLNGSIKLPVILLKI